MITEKFFNAVMVFIISCVLLGALAIQIFMKEEPCPLCLLQRLGMMLVGIGGLMNVRFGIRKRHYGLSLLACFFGGFVALRHIALHACPEFPKFGVPFWGLSLYTWSFLVFSFSALYIGVLLTFYDRPLDEAKATPVPWWGHLVFYMLFLSAAVNIVTTLMKCGLGVCPPD